MTSGLRAIASALAVVLLAPSASLGAGWSDATTFPATVDQSRPAVAENANGDAVVAWLATLTGGKHAVQVASSTAGGAFGDPQTIPAAGTTANLSGVDVAIDAAGDALLAYGDDSAPANHAVVATRPAGQAFGAPQAAGGASNIPAAPRVAMLPGGNGVLALEVRSHSENTLGGGMTLYIDDCSISVYSVVPTGAPTFKYRGVDFSRSGTTFSPPCVIEPFDLAVNARGDIVTAAAGNPTGAATTVKAARTPVGTAAFTSPEQSDVGAGTEAAAAVDPQGRFAVTWKDLAAPAVIRAARGVVGSVPGAAVALSPTGAGAQPAGEPTLGIDGAGTATGIWQSVDTGTNRRVFGATLDAAGVPGPLFGPLSGPLTGGAAPFLDPRLAVTAGGAGLALWREPDPVSGLFTVRSAFRPAGGVFGGSQPASPAGLSSGQGRVALGGDDHAVAAFQLEGAPNRIQAVRFEAVPPVFGAVSLPASAVAGVPIAATASATDAHGPVTVRWDWGDGTPPADGAAVNHAYAATAAGARAVTVTATDALGNAASTTRTVDVVVAPSLRPIVAVVANISKASVSPKRFKVGSKSTAQTAAKRKKPKPTPTSTTFSYKLSAPGTLTIALRRTESGRRSGKKCVKPSSKNRKAKKCKRSVLRGTLIRRNLKAASGRLKFTGRIGRKALPTGSYKATLTATNAAGKKGAARTVSFTIVAR